MAYFPFIADIEDMHCLVAGGGRMAFHKVSILSGYDVNIRIVSPEICDGLTGLAEKNKKISIIKREFTDSDIDDMDFVVAAVGDRKLCIHISEICRKCRIPVNAVDIKEACSFIFPAIIRDGNLLVAVSSGGSSPAMAAHIKKKIKENIPDYYGNMADRLGCLRSYVSGNINNAHDRKEIFERLVLYGENHDGDIPDKAVKEILKDYGSGN